MAIVLLVLGLLMFVGLVVVHEWGHFIMARRNGVDIEEFGIGFPPKIKGWQIKGKKTDKNKHLPASAHKGYELTLNWLPLGGFVRLKGEHDSDTEPGTFGAASTLVKTKIMAAGVVMNLITAIVLFTIVALIGMPKLLDNQFTVASDTKIVREVKNKDVVKVAAITSKSPAERAGIKKDSQLIAIGGQQIKAQSDVAKATSQNAGKTVAVTVRTNGKEITKQVTLNKTSPYLGVQYASAQSGYEVRRSTWSAPVVAVGVTKDFTVATFKGLGTALKGLGSIIAGFATGNGTARTSGQTEASSQVSGPVGIFAVLKAGAHEGFGFVLFFVAIISLSLAIFNVLPIPALDGGKLFITYVSRLVGKRISENVENYVYGGSMALLLLMAVLITIVDVKRFF